MQMRCDREGRIASKTGVLIFHLSRPPSFYRNGEVIIKHHHLGRFAWLKGESLEFPGGGQT